jgi:hypothetical protein
MAARHHDRHGLAPLRADRDNRRTVVTWRVWG